jgi:phosphonate transport system substrate-binding protein
MDAIRPFLSACLLLSVLGSFVMAVEEPLRWGIPPWQKSQSIDEIREQYRPVLDWLGERIGRRFVVVGGRSYEDMIDLTAQGGLDLAVLSPVPYIQAKRKNPAIELVATELKWNEGHTALIDSYEGFILALATGGITTVADVRGKTIGCVNLESTSGWRYPNAACKALGLDLMRDSKVLFLGSHPRVTDALVAGSIDAGATWDFNLAEARRKHGDIFRVILKTPPIPNICLVAHPGLGPELTMRIRELLLTIDPKMLDKAPMQGYALRPDSFYDVVRNLVDSEQPAAPGSK